MKKIKILWISIFILGISNILVVSYFLITENGKQSVENTTLIDSEQDTLIISDTTFFVFRKSKNYLQKIELFHSEDSQKVDPIIREQIEFYPNGSIKRLETCGYGYLEQKTSEGAEFIYNINELKFDKFLNLQEYYISKDYKTIVLSDEFKKN